MMELTGFSGIADWYDTYVQVDFDVPFFINETRKTSGEVLELMAGTGRVSIPLLEAGVRLTCVDKSAQMLDVLRQKLAQRGLAATVIQMDVRELNLSKCFDLIILPFHSFAEIVSLEGERQALSRIYQHLSPTGRFICTLGNPATARPADGQLHLFSKHSLAGGQGTLLFWLLQAVNPMDNSVIDFIELFEEYNAAGILKSKRLVELQARRIPKAEFQELAESAGFRVVTVYGDYAYAEFREESSPFMLWELERAERA